MTDKRPWSVTAGCGVSVAIFVWDIVSTMSDEEMAEVSPFLTPALLVIGLIPMIFTVAAFFRRNWGRIALAVISTLGVLAVPVLMHLESQWAESIDTETLLYAVADLTVVVLLFVPAANAWYRNRFAGETVRP